MWKTLLLLSLLATATYSLRVVDDKTFEMFEASFNALGPIKSLLRDLMVKEGTEDLHGMIYTFLLSHFLMEDIMQTKFKRINLEMFDENALFHNEQQDMNDAAGATDVDDGE